MARRKSEAKCPYCDKVCAVAGLTSHVRSKHTDKYQEFQDNKAALIEKYKIVEGQPAPVEATPAPEEEPLPVEDPATPPAPAPAPEQKSAGFLGSVGKALRDW